MTQVAVNGRSYRLPDEPAVIVCVDGGDARYLDDALARGLMPRLAASLADGGHYALGRSQVPSLTNPNNLSIVTGVPPSAHGVPGNHFLGPDGTETQLDDPRFVRAQTIHAAAVAAGVPAACVTTKEKLRRLLATGGVVCVSAERAAGQPLPELRLESAAALIGRPPPSVYDPDCSLYALELGLELVRRLGCRLLYVSLTDAVQHAEPPGGPAADRLYAGIDRLYGRYLDDGFRVALVADHGMNDKPRIVYLDDELGAAGIGFRHVVLPITDPYVRHHAALGSAAWVHVRARERERAREALLALPGVEEVLTREAAAAELELPVDRIGDLVVLADAQTALGSSRGAHDLSALHGPLRSHGGRHEQAIPLVFSHPLRPSAVERLQAGVANADVHDLLLNGAA